MKILGKLFRKKKTGYLTMSNKPTKKRKRVDGPEAHWIIAVRCLRGFWSYLSSRIDESKV